MGTSARAALLLSSASVCCAFACSTFGENESQVAPDTDAEAAQDARVDASAPGDGGGADAGGDANGPPPALAAVRVWLAADSLALGSGDRVATWPDRSALKNDAIQMTASAQPLFKPGVLNGKPIVRFNPGCAMTTTANIGVDGAHDRTVFAVFKLAAYLNNQPIVAFGSGQTMGGAFFLTSEGSDTAGAWYFQGSAADAKGGVTDMLFHIHTVSYDGTKVSWRVDGVELPGFPASRTLDTVDTRLLITRVVDYAEVIVLGSVLPPGDVKAVEAYLNAKYAIH